MTPSPLAMLGIAAIRVYQYTLRGVIGSNCRFFPSCSDYAVDAFRCHGGLRGGALAGWRILRCNPWSVGGYDPVPDSPITGDGIRTAADEPLPAAPAAPKNRQMRH